MSPLGTYLSQIQPLNFFRQPFPWTLKPALLTDDLLAPIPRYSSSTLKTSLQHTENKTMLHFFLLVSKCTTFNFMSPWRKWLWSTRNVKPRVEVSKPSLPDVMTLYFLKVPCFASSPFMYQSSSTAGFDLPEVQFKLTQSPIWYFARPPVIVGSLSGRSEKKTQS